MFTKQKYYKWLQKNLIENHSDIFDRRKDTGKLLTKIPRGLFDDIYKLMDLVEAQYEFDMQKMIVPNYIKFFLWQDNFGQIDYEKIHIATEFILYCCLADKLLDSKRFPRGLKEKVCLTLVNGWDNMAGIDGDFWNNISHVHRPIINDQNHEEVIGLSQLNLDITKYYINNVLSKDNQIELLDCIRNAFISEIYMYQSFLPSHESFSKKDLFLVCDKSVQFEKAAFLFALPEWSSNRKKLAEKIGEVFMLVDDLCDFCIDIQTKTRNSLLYLCCETVEDISLEDRIEITLNNLDDQVERLINILKDIYLSTDEDFSGCIIEEVWRWCTDACRVYI